MKRQTDSDGRVYFTIKSAEKIYRYYEDSKIYPSDVWSDISHIQQKSPERTGYDTQKPEKLPPGEFAYIDDQEVLCRMDIRQCDKSKVTTQTTEAIVFANSNPKMPDEVLLKACEHVCELIKTTLNAEANIIAFK